MSFFHLHLSCGSVASVGAVLRLTTPRKGCGTQQREQVLHEEDQEALLKRGNGDETMRRCRAGIEHRRQRNRARRHALVISCRKHKEGKNKRKKKRTKKKREGVILCCIPRNNARAWPGRSQIGASPYELARHALDTGRAAQCTPRCRMQRDKGYGRT